MQSKKDAVSMSQLIVDQVAKAIRLAYLEKMVTWPDVAKAAIGAMRDLPDSTFESGTQKLNYIRVIDNIGRDIATGK